MELWSWRAVETRSSVPLQVAADESGAVFDELTVVGSKGGRLMAVNV
jgi:hypothetical protein